MSGWWAGQPEAQLSQGDICADLLVQLLETTPKFLNVLLSKETLPKIGQAWLETPEWKPNPQGIGHALARGRKGYCIVLNHSCDLDKRSSKRRVLIAPVAPLVGLPPVDAERIMGQRRFNALPLPGVPHLKGDHYADLRLMTAVDRDLLDRCERVASMTEDGRKRLKWQLAAFFTRLDTDSEGKPLDESEQ